jgi:drug/metabolite transporter (DMT)-like permease
MGLSMTARAHTDNKGMAVLCAFAAVGIATSGDALVKWMSGSYPVHEILFFRCLAGFPILVIIAQRHASLAGLFAAGWLLSLLRSTIMCSAYLAFILAIAAMPMADVVSIYFAMPLIVAMLAGPMLGERVRIHRWLAIIAGFVGVLIMIRPGQGVFEPAALLALHAAFGYAIGQLLARRIVRTIPPAVMALHTNGVYFLVATALAVIFWNLDLQGIEHKSIAFLVRPWLKPPIIDLAGMALLGTTVAFAMVLFGTAYKYAESSFVAPFEYTAMLWAVVLGFVVFGEVPGMRTLWGGAVVLAAGLFMVWGDRRITRVAAEAH